MSIDNPFQRPKRSTFPVDGVDVNSPVDTPKSDSKAARLKNLTVDSDGSLTIRPGLITRYIGGIIASKTPVHSARRLSDPDGTWAMHYGVQDRLAAERSSSPGTRLDVDGAYSGNPLAIIPWRPTQSPKPYSYVYDSLRQRKLAVDSITTKPIGISPPGTPPDAEMRYQYFSDITSTTATAGWAADGTVVQNADITLLAGGRVAAGVTITRAVRDVISASPTGVCLQPSDMSNIGPGTELALFNGIDAETIIVKEVYRKSSTAAGTVTIGAIIYDSGTTGLCTVNPSVAVREIKRNALVQIGGGTTEYVRVLEVVAGPNDTFAFRCSTATNHAAGNSLQVQDSFRAVIANGSIDWSGATVTQAAIEFSNITTGVTGLGYIQKTGLTLDLTRLPINVTPAIYPITDEDYFHISLRCSNWTRVTMVRVIFDVDDGTCNKNYYYWTIEQSLLIAASKGTQKPTDAQRKRLQELKGSRPFRNRQAFDSADPQTQQEAGTVNDQSLDTLDPEPGSPNPTTPSAAAGTGDNQWSEIRWKRGEMFRVGSDLSKGWHNVVSVRVEMTVSSITARLAVNSLVVYGGSAPDVGNSGLPYQYRYRYRDSSTGAVSAYSPASRGGLYAWRHSVSISVIGVATTDADKIDIERFGGLQGGWCYVGTIDNPGAGVSATYTDETSDIAALRNAVVSDQRVIQPWIRSIAPLSGTCNVSGSAIDDNGSNPLTEKILPGTLIIVNGVATSIRRLFGSGSTRDRWELADSAGSGTAVKWEIPNPKIYGQPIGRVFGPFEGCIFACDGQYVRWTNGYDPDATAERNYAEVTDPSDVTVAGFVFNGRAGVLTTRKLYSISGDPITGFVFTEVPFGKGAFTPYGVAVGPRVAWIARDGIYESSGGEPIDITTDDLSPLFPMEGRVGVTTNNLSAPKIDSTEQQHLRLAYLDDDSLMFSYRDSGGTRHHLRYVHDKKRWYPYDYAKQIGGFYALEGDGVTGVIAFGADTTTALVYNVGGSTNPTTDDGTGFDCLVRPFSEDFGDPRTNKYFGDLVIDADPANHTTGINVSFLRDNQTVSTSLGAITGTTRTQKRFDLGSGNGLRGKNASLELSWTTEASKQQRLYLWQLALLSRPESIALRATDYSTLGFEGDKYMQGVWIEADTFNIQKTLRIEYDGGTLGATLNITHNGLRREYYPFTTPFSARLVRIATVDTDDWELYDLSWQYVKSIKNDAGTIYSDLGYDGDKYMQGLYIDADTFGVDKIVRIEYDGGQLGEAITINHNGRRKEPYSFATPFIARLLKVTSTDGVAWDLLGVDWRFNPEPPAAKVWQVQFTGFDIPGYKHMFHIRPALATNSTVTMSLFADSDTAYYTTTIASTGGTNYTKLRRPTIVTPAKKFKVWYAKFESTSPFRLYMKDSEVLVKGWAVSGDYQVVKPFGETHRTEGARI